MLQNVTSAGFPRVTHTHTERETHTHTNTHTHTHTHGGYKVFSEMRERTALG